MRNSWNWLVKRFVISSRSVVLESVVRSGEQDIQHEYLLLLTVCRVKYFKRKLLKYLCAGSCLTLEVFSQLIPKCAVFHTQSFNKFFFSHKFQLARLKVAKMSYAKWASTFWIRSLTLPAICQDIVSVFLCINWPWGNFF